MKKKAKKTEIEEPKNLNFSFDPTHLEPPKIYREDQRIERNTNNKTDVRKKPKVKRRLKKKVRNALIVILLLLILISVGVVLSLTTFFNIETINVTGSEIYTAQEIIDNCGIDLGENLFLLNKDSAKTKLEKNLPYVYDAKIKIKLTNAVNIEITDAVASYSIKNKDNTFILLDDKFKVLNNMSAENVEGTVNIVDSKISSAENGSKIVFDNNNVSECLSKISSAVKETQMTEATAISSSGLDKNYIIYEDRITFELGNCDNLENKVYKGLAACEKINSNNPKSKGKIDLSSDKQIYFTEEY